MVRCIFCGEEIEGTVREHLAGKHFASAPPAIPEPKPLPMEEPKNEIMKSENINIVKSENKEITQQPAQKTKRRYLTGTEIITLLQNTNKVFNSNEIQGPLEEP